MRRNLFRLFGLGIIAMAASTSDASAKASTTALTPCTDACFNQYIECLQWHSAGECSQVWSICTKLCGDT